MTRMVYLALMPGKRKAKAVPPSSLPWYKANALKVWGFEGTADRARREIAEGRLVPIGGMDVRTGGVSEARAPVAGPVTLSTLTICRSNFAALHRVYSSSARAHVPVGQLGEYGPVDEDGARYLCLVGRDGSYSRDYQIGHYYEGGAFFWASSPDLPQGDEECVPWGVLEGAAREAGVPLDPGPTPAYKAQRVLLPRGSVGGRPTWTRALKVGVVETATQYWTGGAAQRVKGVASRLPGAEVVQERDIYGAEIVMAYLPADWSPPPSS